jgi:(1->4)-alpha-D-glucan 1-alpha-D-glucosylmutase
MNSDPTRSARTSDGSVPRATTRLQFHKDFPFDRATALVPYFARLGVSHLYASPILKARPGSTHGYDCVDVDVVNPELGGEEALRRLSDAAHAAGLGLVVDIVPNHMGVGNDNRWWQDVLLWGPESRYAFHFDIDWQSGDPALRGKLLAPFLGKGYGEVLEAGELVLACDEDRGFEVRYWDNRFPVAIAEWPALLDGAEHASLSETARLFDAVVELGELPRTDAKERDRLLADRDARLSTARESLTNVLRDAGARAAIDRALTRYTADKPDGHARLHALLERQSYRLASWRVAADEINWRRFFEVTELAGIRVERAEVFDAMHATLFRLFRDGVIDAMRVDHVDGLADPRGYCRELQRRLVELSRERPKSTWNRPWIVVEKILAANEDLRADWKIDGTSGYDFMDEVGSLLHDPRGADPLAVFWHEATGRSPDFREEVRSARRQMLAENLAAEFNTTSRALHRVARGDLDTRDIGLVGIQRALAEMLVQFDVYRTYVDVRGRAASDTAVITSALKAAMPTLRPSDRPVLPWLDHWLGGHADDDAPAPTTGPESRRRRGERRKAITRFQQLTPPLAAKSTEDTAFYRYGRLISRNEVGSSPADFALSIDEFHAKCLRRAANFPHAMLATATHDHKRGADTRARLAVLSEIPERWIALLKRWMVLNAPSGEATAATQAANLADILASVATPSGQAAEGRARAESAATPLPEDQLMLLQTLIGAWPLALTGAPDGSDAKVVEETQAFIERVAGWQVKALREAKRPSDWALPNESYEATCRAYLERIMDPATSVFFREAAAFVGAIGPAAALNGLVQTTLHLTVPGVPDLYQGTEWWDLSMVDPDNRRPVDYGEREIALAKLDDPADNAIAETLASWRDGRIKQLLITRLLRLRADFADLFASDAYQPLAVEGPAAANVLAFLRRSGAHRVIVVVPLHVAPLLEGTDRPLVDPKRWEGTLIVLPPGTASTAWIDVLTGARRRSTGRKLVVSDLLADFSVAVLFDSARA